MRTQQYQISYLLAFLSVNELQADDNPVPRGRYPHNPRMRSDVVPAAECHDHDPADRHGFGQEHRKTTGADVDAGPGLAVDTHQRRIGKAPRAAPFEMRGVRP